MIQTSYTGGGGLGSSPLAHFLLSHLALGLRRPGVGHDGSLDALRFVDAPRLLNLLDTVYQAGNRVGTALLGGQAEGASLLQLALAVLGQQPGVGELQLGLGLVVSKVKGQVFKGVGRVLCFGNQALDGVAQVALVLGLGLEQLGAHAHNGGRGVVARAQQLDQLVALLRRQAQVCRVELDDDLFGGGVLLAEVGCVAEAERGGVCGWLEGSGEFCEASECMSVIGGGGMVVERRNETKRDETYGRAAASPMQHSWHTPSSHGAAPARGGQWC